MTSKDDINLKDGAKAEALEALDWLWINILRDYGGPLEINRKFQLIRASLQSPVADAGQSFAIQTEKLLCAALGKEWKPTGMSIISLIDELAALTRPAAVVGVEKEINATVDGRSFEAMGEFLAYAEGRKAGWNANAAAWKKSLPVETQEAYDAFEFLTKDMPYSDETASAILSVKRALQPAGDE